MYNGKVVDLREKMAGMVEGMKDCPNFEGIIAIQRFARPYDTSTIPRTERLEDFLGASRQVPPITRVGFQDPSIVYYSSGTTGTPKAIVHGTGTLLISLGKEAILHRDIKPQDVAMQYTTTGWIMYKASVGHLIFGGRAVFYDGSPFMGPTGAVDVRLLLRIASEQRVAHLGISPRWMGELAKNGVVPRDEFDLSGLKTVTSTGMVLPDQLFEWFYDVGFPRSTHLCNISGGTDIVSHIYIPEGHTSLSEVYVLG